MGKEEEEEEEEAAIERKDKKKEKVTRIGRERTEKLKSFSPGMRGLGRKKEMRRWEKRLRRRKRKRRSSIR